MRAAVDELVEEIASRERLSDQERRFRTAVGEASTAFRSKDYRQVVAILTGYENRLSPAERAKLEYAKRLSCAIGATYQAEDDTMTYGASTYGDEIADVYDALHGELDPAAIATLVELAHGGPVLELGIGTGRFALPLQERRLIVHGIDASVAMVEKLRAKPGGGDIPVTIGDFSRVMLEETFELIFVAFNTFFGLLTADDQVQCFRNVASMLRPGGAFLIEAFVPDLGRFDRGQRLAVNRVEPRAVWLEASCHDAASQAVESQLVRLSGDGVRLCPLRIRYAWPVELDLMARLAGLRLRDRWAGWDKQPFSSASAAHVSVYERAR